MGQPARGDPKLTGALRREVAAELEELYASQGKSVIGYLRALGVDQHAAQDIAHTAFVHVAERMCKEPSIKDLEPYLFTTVKNVWIDWRRALSKATPMTNPDQEIADPASEEPYDGVVDRIDHQPELEATMAALMQLTPRQREIVVLNKMVNLSAAQIAEILPIGEGTVRYHLSVGLRRLKEILRLSDDGTMGEA